LDLVIELAQEKSFVKLAPVPEAQNKLREREELVTRFFAYSDGLEDYHDKVSPFLFSYAKKMNEIFLNNPSAVETYRQRFMNTMAFVARVFPYGFRRKAKGYYTPRARFEALAIGSYLALKQRPETSSQTIQVDWLASKEFRE